MTPQIDPKPYLIATAESGTLVIDSSLISVSWVPWDIVNKAYNIAGTVAVGTFETIDEAKRAAQERYTISPEDWKPADRLPFEDGGVKTEIHTPEIDGHNILKHGTRWK
jgi:hypothetical protein